MREREVLRAAVCVALGAAAWVLLAVLPGRDGSQVDAGPFFVALMACAALVGAWLGGHPVVAGALLAAPALITAGWLAPRGDEDGLWILWFPVVVFAAGAAAGAHWAAAEARRRLRPASGSRPRTSPPPDRTRRGPGRRR